MELFPESQEAICIKRQTSSTPVLVGPSVCQSVPCLKDIRSSAEVMPPEINTDTADMNYLVGSFVTSLSPTYMNERFRM